MDVALAAVIGTSSVGLAGVIAPALLRFSDRQHERKVRVREQRAVAYERVLHLMHLVDEMAEDAREESKRASVLTWLWGSKEVRELFLAWLNDNPRAYGPDATTEDRRRVADKATAVRQRMADEVQGRVDVD